MSTRSDEDDTDRRISNGRERQRATQRRTDAKLLDRHGSAERHRDQRDGTLGQGGTECREDGTGRLLTDRHPVANPLNAVHEQLA